MLTSAHFVDWGRARPVIKGPDGQYDSRSQSTIVCFFFNCLCYSADDYVTLLMMIVRTKLVKRLLMVPDNSMSCGWFKVYFICCIYNVWTQRCSKVICVISELIIESCRRDIRECFAS
jgi:hypothetical protein